MGAEGVGLQRLIGEHDLTGFRTEVVTTQIPALTNQNTCSKINLAGCIFAIPGTLKSEPPELSCAGAGQHSVSSPEILLLGRLFRVFAPVFV